MRAAGVAAISLGIVAVGILVGFVWRSKRRLDARVAEFLREQEENEGPIDPYAGMAEIFGRGSTPDRTRAANKEGEPRPPSVNPQR